MAVALQFAKALFIRAVMSYSIESCSLSGATFRAMQQL